MATAAGTHLACKMKIKQRSPAFMSTKALVFAFIVVVSVLASFNLSPGSFNTELHQDRPVRQQLLRARDSDPVDSSAEVIEHQFISDAEQSAADAEDALASTEVVEAATDDTVEEDVAADDAALQEANDVLKSSESSSSDAIDADVGLGGSKDTALEDKYHVVVSVSDGVYTEWQVRVVSA